MSAMAPPPSGPLPFWSVLGQAYALPFRHALSVIRLTWAWAFLLALLTGALYRLLDDAQIIAIQEGGGFGPAGLNLLSLLLGLVIGSSVAVGWHRLLLLGEMPATAGYLRLDNTVWRYIAVAGLMLVLSMPFFVAAFVMAQVAPEIAPGPGQPPPELSGGVALLVLVMLAAMCAAFLITTRWSLALPARAVDDLALTLGDSWRLTQGSFWRLFAGTMACYVPTLVVASLVAAPGLAGGGPGGYIISVMLSSAAGLVTSVFPLAFLSLAYRHFMRLGPPTT